MSLKCDPDGPVDNKSSLVRVMVCRLYGAKPIYDSIVTQFNDAYMRHMASCR